MNKIGSSEGCVVYVKFGKVVAAYRFFSSSKPMN